MTRMYPAFLLSLALLLAIGIGISAQEPCSGDPLTIINNDPCSMSMKIDVTDSVTICQIRCLIGNPEPKCGIEPSWIGGTVVADENAENGFYFDPATVRIAEVVAEALQTTICQIAESPKDRDGGLWFIPIDMEYAE